MARLRCRQQTTEIIGEPLDLGVGKVYIERRNGSPMLTARTFIQGTLKVWSTKERTERDARRIAVDQFWELYNRSQREQVHGRLFSDVG